MASQSLFGWSSFSGLQIKVFKDSGLLVVTTQWGKSFPPFAAMSVRVCVQGWFLNLAMFVSPPRATSTAINATTNNKILNRSYSLIDWTSFDWQNLKAFTPNKLMLGTMSRTLCQLLGPKWDPRWCQMKTKITPIKRQLKEGSIHVSHVEKERTLKHANFWSAGSDTTFLAPKATHDEASIPNFLKQTYH